MRKVRPLSMNLHIPSHVPGLVQCSSEAVCPAHGVKKHLSWSGNQDSGFASRYVKMVVVWDLSLSLWLSAECVWICWGQTKGSLFSSILINSGTCRRSGRKKMLKVGFTAPVSSSPSRHRPLIVSQHDTVLDQ